MSVGTPSSPRRTSSAPRGRASWSGLLRLSLVAVPVKAYPVVKTGEAVRFHQLHAGCGQRIRHEKTCPIHGAVEASEIDRGYPYAPDRDVVVEPTELQQIRPERDRALLLDRFLPSAAVDPARFSGRSLFLLPDGLGARRPYQVLAAALQERDCWAVGRVVLTQQRQPVVLRAVESILAVHVLHDPALVRSATDWDGELSPVTASPEESQLAAALIDAHRGPIDWDRYADDTAEKLEALVAAKVAGQEFVSPADEPLQVLELLEALQQSVAAVSPPDAPASRRSA